MSYQVINPFVQFVDPINGKPLSGGSVYFGRQDSDPKNQPTNRINVYAVQDNGSEVLLAQPITLNGAGQPQYSGSVKQLKVETYAGESAYCVQVFNSSGAQKCYSARIYALLDVVSGVSLAALAQVGSSVVIGGSTAGSIGRIGEIFVDARNFGVVFDGSSSSAAANTAALNAWLDYIGTNSYIGVLPDGVACHNGITTTKSTTIIGTKPEGPEFGVRTSYIGSVLKNVSTSNSSITVDATGLSSNTGIRCNWRDFTVYGNKNVVGATAGHGVVLKADNTGENTFIESSVFDNVQVIYSKQSNWGIQGTVFANDWYNCSGSYGGNHGFTRLDPIGGNPVTNNVHNCKFFENDQWGIYNNGMKMIADCCNISQNHTGGFLQRSGYVEINNCDFEGNDSVSIEIRDSSAATYINGGMIHKTPLTKAGWVGVRAATGTAGAVLQDTLFANFDAAGDKIFEATGGSFECFEYRAQNVPASALSNASRAAISRIPNEGSSKLMQSGSVTFTGSGVGQRVAFVTFAQSYKIGYVIVANIDSTGGTVTPNKAEVSVDYDTLAMNQIRLRCTVTDSGVGDVVAYWLAVGN